MPDHLTNLRNEYGQIALTADVDPLDTNTERYWEFKYPVNNLNAMAFATVEPTAASPSTEQRLSNLESRMNKVERVIVPKIAEAIAEYFRVSGIPQAQDDEFERVWRDIMKETEEKYLGH